MKKYYILILFLDVLVSGYGPIPGNDPQSSQSIGSGSCPPGCSPNNNIQPNVNQQPSRGQNSNGSNGPKRPYWWEGANNPFEKCEPGAPGCSSSSQRLPNDRNTGQPTSFNRDRNTQPQPQSNLPPRVNTNQQPFDSSDDILPQNLENDQGTDIIIDIIDEEQPRRDQLNPNNPQSQSFTVDQPGNSNLLQNQRNTFPSNPNSVNQQPINFNGEPFLPPANNPRNPNGNSPIRPQGSNQNIGLPPNNLNPNSPPRQRVNSDRPNNFDGQSFNRQPIDTNRGSGSNQNYDLPGSQVLPNQNNFPQARPSNVGNNNSPVNLNDFSTSNDFGLQNPAGVSNPNTFRPERPQNRPINNIPRDDQYNSNLPNNRRPERIQGSGNRNQINFGQENPSRLPLPNRRQPQRPSNQPNNGFTTNNRPGEYNPNSSFNQRPGNRAPGSINQGNSNFGISNSNGNRNPATGPYRNPQNINNSPNFPNRGQGNRQPGSFNTPPNNNQRPGQFSQGQRLPNTQNIPNNFGGNGNQGSFNFQNQPVPGLPFKQNEINPHDLQPLPTGMTLGGMQMMMMPAGMIPVGGSCSAGSFCVPTNTCNPYNGFIIRDVNTIAAVRPDQPQVPLIECFVPAGVVTDGVCCQESHPIAGTGLD